jgi:hypothetical protein
MRAPVRLPGPASRVRVFGTKRLGARRAERIIAEWVFPEHLWATVAKRYPQVEDPEVRGEVDHALRDWFICCAWRGRRSLGMPSRLVDEAWHALILDSVAYIAFCRTAFGIYLHHFPEGSVEGESSAALVNTVWAWDRSRAGRDHESLLWDLDERHGVEDPWGIPESGLAQARSSAFAGGSTACGVGAGVAGDCPPDAGGGGCGGGGCGGSGCGGGGCGGGGGS